jgi:hypothetical protein
MPRTSSASSASFFLSSRLSSSPAAVVFLSSRVSSSPAAPWLKKVRWMSARVLFPSSRRLLPPALVYLVFLADFQRGGF